MTGPVLWPFDPEWSNPILERLTWLTAIQTSQTGAEQRQALRVYPLRQVDYPVQLTGQQRSYFEFLLAQVGNGPWVVPLPHEKTRTTDALDAGASSFTFDTSYMDLHAGQYVVVKDDWSNGEALIVASVSGTGITTTTGATKSYPSGAVIYPAFIGQIVDTITLSRKTARILMGTVRFESLEVAIWPPETQPAPYVVPTATINTGHIGVVTPPSFPIMLTEPNTVNDLDYSFMRMMKVVGADSAAIPVYVDMPQWTFSSQKYEWFLVGRQEKSNFRDFLFAIKGRCSPIWVPTFNDDLGPNGYPDPFNFVALHPNGLEQAIAFARDGTWFTFNPARSPAQPPPEVFSDAIAFRRSLLKLKRLDVDTIEIQHYTDGSGVSTVSAILRDAPDLRITGLDLTHLPFNANYIGATGSATAATDAPSDLTATETVTGVAGGETS